MLDRIRPLHTHPVILLAVCRFVTAGAWLTSGINCVNALQLPAQTFNVTVYGAKGDSRVSTQGKPVHRRAGSSSNAVHFRGSCTNCGN